MSEPGGLPVKAWRPAYVGIGSNLGEPLRQVDAAFDALAALPDTRLVARSSRFRSAPLAGMQQPDYVNAAAALLTRLGPEDLLAHLKSIETGFGREPGGERWGPRVLDLDLLAYSNERRDGPALTLPHPGLAARNFVLLPLRELAPDLVVPGLGRVGSLPVADEPRITRMEAEGA
ncbi:MAG TPA: 2-amino-4-hydroxy-6-hydroxymethyldihydropteridine diphosphokinase [Woeseiaceae bacterium]|nr:2-amino-4-hydroxy-6-hydroxymethyldihydropteridine diphosphokinase [Woeseiaceae bacterium]